MTKEEKLLKLKHKATSFSYGAELLSKYPDKFNWNRMNYSKITMKIVKTCIDKINLIEMLLSLIIIGNSKLPSKRNLLNYISLKRKSDLKNISDQFLWRAVISKEYNFSEEFFFDYFEKLDLTFLKENIYIKDWFAEENQSDSVKLIIKLNYYNKKNGDNDGD